MKSCKYTYDNQGHMCKNINFSGSGTAMAFATAITALSAGITDIEPVGRGLVGIAFIFGIFTLIIEYLHIRKDLKLKDFKIRELDLKKKELEILEKNNKS